MYRVKIMRLNKELILTESELMSKFPEIDFLLLKMNGLSHITLKSSDGIVFIERCMND